MQVNGKIKVINPTQEVSASFKKREFVVTTDEQFPQDIIMELTQDKCAELDKYNIGENVKVSINLRGREYVNSMGETKFFNSIQAWRIEKEKSSANNGNVFPEAPVFKEEEHDDLPF